MVKVSHANSAHCNNATYILKRREYFNIFSIHLWRGTIPLDCRNFHITHSSILFNEKENY